MARSQVVSLAPAGTIHNAATTVTGSGVAYRESWREATVTLTVSAAATGAGDTLDVFIDILADGGTTWVNVGHFTQVLGNGGAKTFMMALRSDNPGTSAVTDVTSSASAGNTRQYGVGTSMRYRSTVASSGNFTFGITALLK